MGSAHLLVEQIHRYYDLVGAGSDAAAQDVLRSVLAPDARLCIPERLPYGGAVSGRDDVVQRLDAVREAQCDTEPQFIVDEPVVIHYARTSWRPGTLPEDGFSTLTAEWWYLSADKVREIHLFCFDSGLIPYTEMPAEPGTRSAPEQGLLAEMTPVHGVNITASRELVERVYAGAQARIDVSPYFSEDIVLYQSSGLPYGNGAHHGLHEAGAVIAGVAVWCDIAGIDLRAVVSEGDRTIVAISAPIRGSDQRVFMMEDWNVENGHVLWFRPYYWDPDSVTRAYNDRLDPSN